MNVCKFTTLLIALVALINVANAGNPIRLDDRASPLQRVEGQRTSFDRDPYGNEPPTRAEVHFGWVTYRLDTAAFVGKQARIYFVVPSNITAALSPSAVNMEWKTRGRFQAGQANAGERSLVWHGVLRDARIEEQMDLTMRLRLADIVGRVGFESYFEIEVQ